MREFYERVFRVRKEQPRVPSRTGDRERPRKRRDAGGVHMTAAEKHLSREDLVALLEASALRGNIRAIQLLLERPWERRDEEAGENVSTLDALDNVTPIGSHRKGA